VNNRSIVWNIVGWLFGTVVLAIGVINLFWGNDPGYGVFIFLLSFAFFPPVNTIFKAKTGYRIHPILKILLGLFIFWSALGVGELFDKIELMRRDLFHQ
jgi:hypothetical protein